MSSSIEHKGYKRVNNKKKKKAIKTIDPMDKNMTIQEYSRFRGSADHEKILKQLIGYFDMLTLASNMPMFKSSADSFDKLIRSHNQFFIAEALGRKMKE